MMHLWHIDKPVSRQFSRYFANLFFSSFLLWSFFFVAGCSENYHSKVTIALWESVNFPSPYFGYGALLRSKKQRCKPFVEIEYTVPRLLGLAFLYSVDAKTVATKKRLNSQLKWILLCIQKHFQSGILNTSAIILLVKLLLSTYLLH